MPHIGELFLYRQPYLTFFWCETIKFFSYALAIVLRCQPRSKFKLRNYAPFDALRLEVLFDTRQSSLFASFDNVRSDARIERRQLRFLLPVNSVRLGRKSALQIASVAILSLAFLVPVVGSTASTIKSSVSLLLNQSWLWRVLLFKMERPSPRDPDRSIATLKTDINERRCL